MGGTNELRILGYRAHVNNGKVHLHNEDGIKFAGDLRSFKQDIADAAAELKSKDGAIAIDGEGDVKLVVGRYEARTFTALTVSADASDDLRRWVEGC